MAVVQDSPLFKKNSLNAALVNTAPRTKPTAPVAVEETVKETAPTPQKPAESEKAVIRATPSVVAPAIEAPVPPTALERPVKPASDPWKAFGSPAMIVAALGGRMTKRPLTSALNSATAAMKAKAAGDEAAHQEALEQWKSHTDAAQKNYEYQRDAYKDAYDRNISDRTTQAAELKALASAFGDNAGLAILNGQGTDAFMGHNAGIGKLMNNLGIAALEIKPGGAGGKTKDERYMQRVKELEAKDKLTDDEQTDLNFYKEALATSARGGMDPSKKSFDTATGRGLGQEYSAIQSHAADIPTQRTELQRALNASVNLGEVNQGPIAGKLGAWSSDAQVLEAQSTKDALKFVNDTKGAVSDKEMEMFKKASVGINNHADVNQSLLKMALAVVERDGQKAEFYANWADRYGSTNGAAMAWKRYVEENPLWMIDDSNNVQLLKDLDQVKYDKTWFNYLDRSGNAPSAATSSGNYSDLSNEDILRQLGQ